MTHHTGSVPDTEPAYQWRDDAACTNVDPDAMFPGNDRAGIAYAKSICRMCPVVVECLLDALAIGDTQHGIRGGLTPQERRAYARKREQARVRLPEPTTLAEAFLRLITVTDDGHTILTGTGKVAIYFRGHRFPPLQTAFRLGHGRDPVGRITRTCKTERCVAIEHLADEPMRATIHGTRAAYLRHKTRGEDCEECSQANTDADNRLRRTGSTAKAAA